MYVIFIHGKVQINLITLIIILQVEQKSIDVTTVHVLIGPDIVIDELIVGMVLMKGIVVSIFYSNLIIKKSFEEWNTRKNTKKKTF